MNSKVYRLLIQFQRLAQFDPDHESCANFMLGKLLTDDDAENYRKLDFTPEMIQFTEENAQ